MVNKVFLLSCTGKGWTKIWWTVSPGDNQADEQAGVTRLSCRLSSRCTDRCHAAQLATVNQKSRQVSRGSAGVYQADEQAVVTRLSWRISSR